MFDFLRKILKTEHERVEELLSAYIDEALSSRERALVEKHLGQCRECAHSLDTLRWTVNLLGETPTVQVPRSFAIRPALAPTPMRPLRPAWAYATLRVSTALAALLLVMVLAGDFLSAGLSLSGMPVPAPGLKMAAASPTPVPLEAEDRGRIVEQVVGEPSAAGTPVPSPAAVPKVEITQAEAAPTGQTEIGLLAFATPSPQARLGAGMVVSPTSYPTSPTSTSPPEMAVLPSPTAMEVAAVAATPPPVEAAKQPPPRPQWAGMTPWRWVELALLVLVIVLGISTVAAGRRQ